MESTGLSQAIVILQVVHFPYSMYEFMRNWYVSILVGFKFWLCSAEIHSPNLSSCHMNGKAFGISTINISWKILSIKSCFPICVESDWNLINKVIHNLILC